MIEDLLDAPCIFCGYNGPEYWQPRSHEAHCHCYNLGGLEARKEMLPADIRAVYAAGLDAGKQALVSQREAYQRGFAAGKRSIKENQE